jgi:hypothetical protein
MHSSNRPRVGGKFVIQRLILIVLLAFAGATNPAWSADSLGSTVQSLRDMCKSDDADERALCVGFIAGVGDYMRVVSATSLDQRLSSQLGLCGWATHGAMLQAFMNWSDKHPEQWSNSSEIGVGMALRETWPCVQKSN